MLHHADTARADQPGRGGLGRRCWRRPAPMPRGRFPGRRVGPHCWRPLPYWRRSSSSARCRSSTRRDPAASFSPTPQGAATSSPSGPYAIVRASCFTWSRRSQFSGVLLQYAWFAALPFLGTACNCADQADAARRNGPSEGFSGARHIRAAHAAPYSRCAGDTLFSSRIRLRVLARKIYLDRPDDDGAPKADLHVAQNAAS